jgi:hypothetical protein
LPHERRRWSDAVRGGLAGGILASFPATAMVALAVVLIGWLFPLLLMLLASAWVIGVGVWVGASCGWVYGITARHDFYLARYLRSHCRRCGYDLTGGRAESCPECGQPLRPAQVRHRVRQALTDATGSGHGSAYNRP